MKLKFHPIMILAATSLVCVVVSGTSIVSAQEVEVEVEETTIEATIPGEAIPEESITIDDPNIEISDLKLLVKPLTLEELQHEGAAWLFLLKDKTREISNAEIAIKRENRKIDKEKQSIKSLKNAQKQVLEAEKAQAKANQNNKGKEEAAKKVQKAKEALKAAEASMEEVREDHDKLEADEIQQKWVREAQEKRVIIEARAILEKAKIIRQDVADDSPQYEKVTDKIDALEESINALEKTEASLIGKIPGSSKYKNVKGKISQAREAVKNATLDLVKIMPGLEIDPDSSFSLTGAAIAQDTSENLDHNTEHNEHQIAPPPSNLDHVEEHLDTDHLDESEGHKLDQQLEEIDEELEHHAEEEAKVKNQLVANATKLQAQQTTIIDRFNVILDELDAKGGETVGYRKYIDAINGIEIDLTDLEGSSGSTAQLVEVRGRRHTLGEEFNQVLGNFVSLGNCGSFTI